MSSPINNSLITYLHVRSQVFQRPKGSINICIKLKIYIGIARWHDWWIVRIIEHHVPQIFLSLKANTLISWELLETVPVFFIVILHNVDKIVLSFHILRNFHEKYQVICCSYYHPTICKRLHENQ